MDKAAAMFANWQGCTSDMEVDSLSKDESQTVDPLLSGEHTVE